VVGAFPVHTADENSARRSTGLPFGTELSDATYAKPFPCCGRTRFSNEDPHFLCPPKSTWPLDLASSSSTMMPVAVARWPGGSSTAFEVLAESPKSVPTCDHIRPGYRRRNVERHMIYFRITDYGIAIIRVLHGRMDAPHYL
jgi:plasmid stabilization system protein ParE